MENKIIKFGAAWCGPCNAMAPQLAAFKTMIAESNVEVIDIDIDAEENAAIAQQYGVRSIPMTVFIKEDVVQQKLVGMKTSSELFETYKSIYDN